MQVCHELTEIMKSKFQELAQEHGIYLSSDDDLNLQSLLLLFDEAKRRIAFADEQRQRFTAKYTNLLDKSISQLHTDVLSVAEMANNPLLSSLNTTTRDAALHLVVVIAKQMRLQDVRQRTTRISKPWQYRRVCSMMFRIW